MEIQPMFKRGWRSYWDAAGYREFILFESGSDRVSATFSSAEEMKPFYDARPKYAHPIPYRRISFGLEALLQPDTAPILRYEFSVGEEGPQINTSSGAFVRYTDHIEKMYQQQALFDSGAAAKRVVELEDEVKKLNADLRKAKDQAAIAVRKAAKAEAWVTATRKKLANAKEWIDQIDFED